LIKCGIFTFFIDKKSVIEEKVVYLQRQTGMAVWPKSKNINKIQLNTIKKT
jgi:hypothetical protein